MLTRQASLPILRDLVKTWLPRVSRRNKSVQLSRNNVEIQGTENWEDPSFLSFYVNEVKVICIIYGNILSQLIWKVAPGHNQLVWFKITSTSIS